MLLLILQKLYTFTLLLYNCNLVLLLLNPSMALLCTRLFDHHKPSKTKASNVIRVIYMYIFTMNKEDKYAVVIIRQAYSYLSSNMIAK